MPFFLFLYIVLRTRQIQITNKILTIINNNLSLLSEDAIIICETELNLDYSIYNNILIKSIGKSHKFKEILYQKTTNFFH